MSKTTLCRLCLNISVDGKNLYSETGHPNEIHEIGVKYFHPMFLSVGEDNRNTVMCLVCWHHISEFHNYQQTVFEAQRKLLNDETQVEFLQTVNDSATIKREEEEDTMSLPDLELIEDYNFDDDAEQSDEYSDDLNKAEDNTDNVVPRSVMELINEPSMPEQSISPFKMPVMNLAKRSITQTISEESSIPHPQSFDFDDIQAIKKKRKSQTEIDSCISQWRATLQCVACGAHLRNFALLQDHFRHEHPSEECYVTCCNRKFNTRSKIEEHARFHSDPNAFTCKKCGCKLSSEASLYTHTRRCQPQRVKRFYTKTPVEEIDSFIAMCNPSLICEICQKSCATFTLLKAHFRDDHSGKEFYVKCCDRRFNSRSLFKEHVWLHMDPNAFRCQICDRLHSRFKCLQVHMERAHSILLQNMRPNEVFAKVKLPPYDFTKLQNLSHIVPEMHIITPDIPCAQSAVTNFNGKTKYDEFDEILSAWKPVLICVVCGEACRAYSKLQQHFRSQHPREKCFIVCCEKPLSSRSEIEEHMSLHQNSNAYKCYICNSSHHSRESLREHLKIQHPQLVPQR